MIALLHDDDPAVGTCGDSRGRRPGRLLLPALPGTVLIFAGLLLAAWADGSTRVGAGTLVLLGVIAAARYGVDFVAAALGVRRLGATPRAMAGAAIGASPGLFLDCRD